MNSKNSLENNFIEIKKPMTAVEWLSDKISDSLMFLPNNKIKDIVNAIDVAKNMEQHQLTAMYEMGACHMSELGTEEFYKKLSQI